MLRGGACRGRDLVGIGVGGFAFGLHVYPGHLSDCVIGPYRNGDILPPLNLKCPRGAYDLDRRRGILPSVNGNRD